MSHRLTRSFGFAALARPAWLALAMGLLLLTACKQELYSNLSEREANEMTAILLQNDVPAARTSNAPGVYSVQVGKDHFAEAVEILKERGYPREDFATLGDVFSGEGLISSPMEERARFIFALSQELSRTINEIDGVLSARVHIVLPDNDPLRSELAPSSASVFIRHDERAQIQALLPQIKILVANSIEGLVYDKVSVVLFAAPSWTSQQVAATQRPQNAIGFPILPSAAEDADILILSLIGLLAAVLLGNVAFFLRWQRRRREAPPA